MDAGAIRETRIAAGVVAAALVAAMLLAGGCVRPPGSGRTRGAGGAGGAEGSKVVAARVEKIGGWESVRGATVRLKATVRDCDQGHLGDVDAVVKAQRTDDVIAISVSWPDSTKSETHRSWVWNDEFGAYQKQRDYEDRVALMFNIEGDFSSCMLEGKTFRADCWHWKAARTAPAGLAHDKLHVYSLKPVHEKSRVFVNSAEKEVYMARVSDAGDDIYASAKEPAAGSGARLPGYVVNMAATGSIADVKAEAAHDGKGWTVTMTRRLDTGHDDDVRFEKGKTYEAAVACFDRSGDTHHSTAGFVLAVE